MAIDAYTGIPGAGKSHGVVENVIIPALKEGRLVVHNMPLNEAEILRLAGAGALRKLPDNVTIDDIIKDFPAGAVLVLDEAWKFLPAGLKANNIPEPVRGFFAMHRHMVGEDGKSTDIALSCQDLSQLAAFLRDLVEQTFRYKKQTVIGRRDRYRCDVYQGPVTGPHPPISKRINELHGKYRPEIYACYRSHTLSTTGQAGQEQKIDKRGSLLSGFRFKVTLASLVLLIPLFFAARHTFYAISPRHAERSEAGRGEMASGGKPLPPSVPAVPVDSSAWRLAGFIHTRHGGFYLVEGEHGARRVSVSACSVDLAGNTSCLVDGSHVTEWTGPEPGVVQQFMRDAVRPEPPA